MQIGCVSFDKKEIKKEIKKFLTLVSKSDIKNISKRLLNLVNKKVLNVSNLYVGLRHKYLMDGVNKAYLQWREQKVSV